MSVRGTPSFGLNAPSKFAQRALTKIIAQEYEPYFKNMIVKTP